MSSVRKSPSGPRLSWRSDPLLVPHGGPTGSCRASASSQRRQRVHQAHRQDPGRRQGRVSRSQDRHPQGIPHHPACADQPRPGRPHHPHHMIPCGCAKVKDSWDILKNHGIDIDSPENGVGMSEKGHSGTFTGSYYIHQRRRPPGSFHPVPSTTTVSPWCTSSASLNNLVVTVLGVDRRGRGERRCRRCPARGRGLSTTVRSA
ncbi:AHH domain-containing protein [Streptomyces beihaiensis]|uniref:AHH domain-containing protein n=1 Tax=Streptomyces beihaiensis TaxID=2984495 RepID=UPI00389A50FA